MKVFIRRQENGYIVLEFHLNLKPRLLLQRRIIFTSWSRISLVSLLLFLWLFSGWPSLWRHSVFSPELHRADAAISSVTARGSSVSGTGNNASISVTPTANITAGKMAFFAVVTDNESTTDGCSGTLHSLTGSAGNTWEKILECTDTDGASNDGVTISLFATKVTTQINTTDTITVTFNTVRSDIIAMLFEATVSAGNTLEIAQIGTGQASLTSSVSGLTSREYLLLNLIGVEGEDNSKTQSTNFTELFDLWSTNSGQNDTNVSSYIQTRIATLTSSGSVTPGSWTNNLQSFASLTALFEDALPTLSVSQPDGNSDTITVGDSYNITYSLTDSDDVVTAAFYYDTNTDMSGGTAISGACASADEVSTTCSWDTTGVTPGSYYVYGVVSGDGGINGQVKAISSGQITINAATSLTFIVSTDNFANLTPGTPVWATSTLSVDTNNATGWNVTLYGNNVSGNDTQETAQALNNGGGQEITDLDPQWTAPAATTTVGNAVAISQGDDVLAFRVMSASGTQAFRSTNWWGTDDSPFTNALWAGLASSTNVTRIGNSSVQSDYNGGSAALNTVQYYLDVPASQPTGTYTGTITFTITGN